MSWGGSVVCLCWLLAAGCSSGRPSYEMTPVSGAVTFDGKPIEGANVVFHSETGPSATGTTDSSGQFSLATRNYGEGIPPGDYLVQINSTPATKNAAGKSIAIPIVYGENGVEVVKINQGSDATFTFALKSKPKSSDYVANNPLAEP